MDFNVNHESFTMNEVAYEGNCEQSVELDYILPDYFPDIFRILKCSFDPKIISHSLNGEKLVIDMIVCIKILYLCEESHNINCIEQKQTFQKTVEIGKGVTNPVLKITPSVDYVNCRVVNQRRLDIRGAVSAKVVLIGEKPGKAVCGAVGRSVQLKKQYITYPAKRLTAAKRITITEDLELGKAKSRIKSIIKSDCSVLLSEQKVIANKLVIKGESNVSLLYNCEDEDEENSGGIDTIKFSVPFSQIIDVEGITEQYETMTEITVASLEIIPKSGEKNEIECEIIMFVTCSAYKFETSEFAVDAYSTKYECSFDCCEAKIEKCPVRINESETVKAQLKNSGEEIKSAFFAWAKPYNIQGKFSEEESCFTVFGNIDFGALAKDKDGCPVYLEDTASFEHKIVLESECENPSFDPCVYTENCTFNITGDCSIEVKAELFITGYIRDCAGKTIITDVSVNEEKEKPKTDDYTLKLYFAEPGEDIWEIAKKFSTSAEAIMEENDIRENFVSEKGMILIPILD